jgi:hypothetical protein
VSKEAQAKELGWTELDSWVEKGGDPDKWRDADAFMEFGERNANFQKKVADQTIEDKTQEFDERIKNIERMSSEAMKRQRDKDRETHQAEVATLKAQRKAAAQNDDTAGVLDATERLEELRPPDEPADNNAKTKFDQKVVPLILSSEKVRMFSDVAAATINRDNPDISPAEFYVELEQQIQDEFSGQPEFARYFGKRVKPQSRVDSTGTGPASEVGEGWDELPPEAKAMGAEFIKDGLFKDKAAYAVEYHK